MILETQPMSNLAKRIAELLDEYPKGLTDAQLSEKTNSHPWEVRAAADELPNIRIWGTPAQLYIKVQGK